MPLEAGSALSFFAAVVFPPLGMRLAILEAFLAGSEVTSSLGGVLALFLLLLLSSLGWGKDLLAFLLLLTAIVVVVLALAVFLFEGVGDGVGILPGGLGHVPPSSPYSDRSSSSCKAIRVLTSLNFSSIDRWFPGADLEASGSDGRDLSEVGGGGEEAGLLANMDDVALCFMFMDLLRHDWPVVGEGMADANC